MIITNNKYFILFIMALVVVSCKQQPSPQPQNRQAPRNFNDQLVDVNRNLIKKDRQKIIDLIDKNGWKMTETGSGLWYEVIFQGTGDSAKEGMVANLKYTLRLLDGTICYSSDQDGIKSFLIGKGNVESGLEKGILILTEGSKARFILPPHLAHGLPGDGNKIPARATILYEVELLSLKRKE